MTNWQLEMHAYSINQFRKSWWPLILFWTCLFQSCSPFHKNDCETIDFNKVSGNRDVFLSEVVDSLEYVALDSNDSCYIGSVGQIRFTSDFIYVSDRTLQRVLAFNSKGKFIRQIGRQGKGPGEYPHVFCFTTDSIGQNIYIYTLGDLILHYNIKEGFMSTTKIDYCRFIFFSLVSDCFVLNVPYPNTIMSNGISCFIVDKKGQIIKKILKKKIGQNSSVHDLSGYNKYYSYDRSVSLWESKYDTIYAINSDFTVTSKYALSYGNINKNSVQDPVKFDQRIKNGAFTVSSFLETPRVLLFNTIEKGLIVQFAYFKENKQLYRNKNESNKGFFNDVDKGPRFKLEGIINENVAYALLWPVDLMEFFNTMKESPVELEKWKIKLQFKEDYNPILVKCYLRK